MDKDRSISGERGKRLEYKDWGLEVREVFGIFLGVDSWLEMEYDGISLMEDYNYTKSRGILISLGRYKMSRREFSVSVLLVVICLLSSPCGGGRADFGDWVVGGGA